MTTRRLVGILTALVLACVALAAVVFTRPDPPTRSTSSPSSSSAPVRPLPTDRPPAAGTPPVRQTLSRACTKAVAPLRALAAAHPSALLLDAEGSAALTKGLATARAGCGPEFQRFYTLELRGWLSPGS